MYGVCTGSACARNTIIILLTEGWSNPYDCFSSQRKGGMPLGLMPNVVVGNERPSNYRFNPQGRCPFIRGSGSMGVRPSPVPICCPLQIRRLITPASGFPRASKVHLLGKVDGDLLAENIDKRFGFRRFYRIRTYYKFTQKI